MGILEVSKMAEDIRKNIGEIIVGKESTIDLILISLISSGHILLEDVPGTGKTLIAKALAKSLDVVFKRVQFTPDLLPSDLTGINFFNQKSGEFQFREGPIFTNILLADEINRATPRTQSSLLECMQERQVTVDGETYFLSNPFLVIATQNPIENLGTFPLPEAQLDRFFISMDMGYPSENEGIEILKRFKENDPMNDLGSVIDAKAINTLSSVFSLVKINDDLLKYIIRITEETRKHSEVSLGLSPRGSQALLKASQARAALHGRNYVIPDDIKEMIKPVAIHRIIPRQRTGSRKKICEQILDSIIEKVLVPTEEGLVS